MGRGMRGPESWLEMHETYRHGWSIGKRYEKPKVMAREALGLDYWWSSGKRYERPRVMVGEASGLDYGWSIGKRYWEA